MNNWFTICTDRTDGQGFLGATLYPCNNANYLIHERILHIYRSCIHFSIRTDGQLRFTDGQLVYHRYRPYLWTRFLGATLCPCNNANDLIHERILHIYRSCIHFSIRTDGQLRFTDGQLVYHRYRPYRWTRFVGATLCPCNNANYLIHERILHIYRSCIHLSIRTDGQLRFTDGKLVYHLYRPCRWTRFLRATLCPCNNANYLIHERILYIYRSCNHFSIRTDGQLRFTDGKLVYHLYRLCRWARFLRAILCPCNNANYLIHERIFHIYRSCIHLSIRTDGQLRFTDGELVYNRYRPYRWTRFLGATLCPCNNANYLIHERILHIYRSCIHFSIRTDGQLRFTDGKLVYHLYRPCRWTRFLGATLCPCNNANYLIHEKILHIYRSCIHFSIRPDGQLRFTDGQLVYHRYRPYRFTRFLWATLCPCNNANYLIHERILHIYRSCIHFSIRTDGQLRFTDGELVYHRYRPYRWTRFFEGYLMPLQ